MFDVISAALATKARTTVDQNYESGSVNPQSGAAVAQAILETVGDINTILATLVDGV